MSETRAFVVAWECRVDAESADDALAITCDAMTDIKQRKDLQRWTVREVGSPIGRTVDRRPVSTVKGNVPLGTVLRKDKP